MSHFHELSSRCLTPKPEMGQQGERTRNSPQVFWGSEGIRGGPPSSASFSLAPSSSGRLSVGVSASDDTENQDGKKPL